MNYDQKQYEKIVISVAKGIYRSSLIPESHKKAYVDYILDHGLTEKMITELRKIFEKEKQALEMDVKEKLKIVEGLKKFIEEEQERIDKPRAEILTAFDDYSDRKVQECKQGLEKIEIDMEHSLEEAQGEEEESEEEAIRAKLGISHKE